MNPLRILVFLALMVGPLGAAAPPPASPVGHWEGAITLPNTRLAIHLDFENAKGVWSGTIDIPVQNLRNFRLDPVSVDGSAIRFSMPAIPGDPTFVGKLAVDGRMIGGGFTQGGQEFPFEVARTAVSAATAGETPDKGLPGNGIVGSWQGSLKPTPIIALRLGLEITNTAGKLDGVLISLDQGQSRIPLTSIADADGKVLVKIDKIGGTFEGRINADGSEIAGDWQQGRGAKEPLVFKRTAKTVVLNRLQEPKKPFPYSEEEVRIENEVAGIRLAGTLTLPQGNGPHPVVVLITGSGPQDRDESVMGHKPFLVLADHLARRGIAVLRYDDRGVAKSTGDFSAATHLDFVEDALAAVRWLKARPEIDPKHIGLVGHSEGGVVAPLAAVKQPDDIAHIVLLAGVGVPMSDLLVRQGVDLGRVMGMDEKTLAKIAAAQRAMYPKLNAATTRADAEKIVRETSAEQLAEYTVAQREAMGLTDVMIEQQVKTASSPWFRTLIAYDPAPTLRRVTCPVLAINGEKDLQVACNENLEAIAAALKTGGNSHVKTIAFPGLNHLFQTCETGAVSEYGQIEETFNPRALTAVSDWIAEQASR
jgi:pimeloyl-ACP methyl ester carboxylesterase